MRALLTALVVCSAALGTRVAGETASFAVPFFEVEELKASGTIAVGRFASLMDERSLYAIRLTDGRVLVRIDRVGRAPFALDGGQLVYAPGLGDSIIAVDLQSNQREELWKAPAGSRVVGIEASDRSVLITVEDATGLHSLALFTPRRSLHQDASAADYVAWPERRDGRLFLRASPIASPPATVPTRPVNRDVPRLALDSSAARGIGWLERQLSTPFVSRHGRTARLIDSYEDAERAGWIYDAALAAIVFTAAGVPARASELIAGLEHLQRDDGSWIASFHPDTAMPRGTDRYVGAMAWVVMAVNFFESDTQDARFAPMARRGLGYLERYRVAEAGTGLYGAFRMGPSRPATISTEHNADCYSAFLWRGRLDLNQRYVTIADEIRAFVLRQLWVDPDHSAASGGHFRVGVGATGLYLDAQTWTTLALVEDRSDTRFTRALELAEQRLRVETGRLGHAHDIVGFDESDETNPQKVWAEGSEGMAAALFAVGDAARARLYHAQTATYQRESGGIPYATENPSRWTTAPSVAATGWYVLNSLPMPRNPFRPGFRSTH
jgi:hypothetical protein